MHNYATSSFVESKLSLKKFIPESQTLGIKMFAYQCGGQILRNQSQNFQKYLLVLEPKFFCDKLEVCEQSKIFWKTSLWRLWALSCFHLSTCGGADRLLLCLSNTIFIFPGLQMYSIRPIQPNLLTVTMQSNKIIPLTVTDTSHKQCFFHFIPPKDADPFR